MYFVVIEDDSLYDRFMPGPSERSLIDYRDTSCSEGANSAQSSTSLFRARTFANPVAETPSGRSKRLWNHEIILSITKGWTHSQGMKLNE